MVTDDFIQCSAHQSCIFVPLPGSGWLWRNVLISSTYHPEWMVGTGFIAGTLLSVECITGPAVYSVVAQHSLPVDATAYILVKVSCCAVL